MLLAAGLVVAHAQLPPEDPVCSDDDVCHFGSCDNKLNAVGNATHNAAPVPCGHPYSVALLTYINRATEPGYPALVARCGALPIRRPACETRTVKTRLDLVLVTIFLVSVVFKITPILF